MPNPDVFVSYSRTDKSRVAPLVHEFKQAGHSVWWDPDLQVGSNFREVIQAALDAASAVVVVWSRSSVKKDFVLDEATQANRRGVLRPVRVDTVDPPLGFGQLQFVDLVGWPGGASPEVDKLLQAIAALVTGIVQPAEKWWRDLAPSAATTRAASDRLHKVTVDIRTVAALFRTAPSSMASLTTALREVYRTYDAVLQAMKLFMKGSEVTLHREDFVAMARGSLRTLIGLKRGHCTAIGLAYWGDGGIRQSLTTATASDLSKLDKLFGFLATADGDAFARMADIADSLAGEAAAVANLLVDGQIAAARSRLDADARELQKLEAVLNSHVAELLHLGGELGISIDQS